MGVIISEMKMPEKCSDCKLRKPLKLCTDDCLVCGCLFKSVDGPIEKLKEKAYSESEYGVDEFDASKVIQLSDAIEIVKDYCGEESEDT